MVEKKKSAFYFGTDNEFPAEISITTPLINKEVTILFPKHLSSKNGLGEYVLNIGEIKKQYEYPIFVEDGYFNGSGPQMIITGSNENSFQIIIKKKC